jgi:hypothetical protein
MENKRFNKGLVVLLAAGAIIVTSILGGCDYNKKTTNFYQRVDDCNKFSYEEKQAFKEEYRNFNIGEAEKRLCIDPKELKKLNKKQRKKMAIEFNKDIAGNLMDPNNVSYKDIIVMYDIAVAAYPGNAN